VDNEEYVLDEGTHVSYWYQGQNYAVVKNVAQVGVTLKIYKIIADKYDSDDYEPECSAGDIVFFSWMACPNFKIIAAQY
tara:strand:- start:482 stop:718 length:237 start_codon:yes stop_codon:yes gene_type:complete